MRGKALVASALLAAAMILTASRADAQFFGHNLTGDFGLMAGSQPPPGLYLSALYANYNGDTLRDKDGNSIAVDPERRGDLDVNAYALGMWYVSDFKILGGNYGLMAFPAFTDNKLEVPVLGFEQNTGTGLTDLYFQPINLGWHTERADFLAGLGIVAPTGRYDPDALDNLGLGMWSFEFFGGTTLFLDKAKTWHIATTAFYETHTEKKDTDIRVGDILTLEGGLGKSFLEGTLNVGVAYYAQWKLTDDDLGQDIEALLGGRKVGKHRYFGVGPDITIPLATKKNLIGLLNARYLWETGARSTVEGGTFVLIATFPIPSIPLQ